MNKWRKIVVAVVAFATINTSLKVADSVLAIAVERKIVADVTALSPVEVAPSVYVAGIPYVQGLVTGKLPLVSVSVQDAAVPGAGMVNGRTEITDMVITPEQLLTGNLTGAPAEMIRHNVGLDGVALGAQLGMTDLNLANPYDISPGGGEASEVELTGTPPGFDDPVTVVAKLRLVGEVFKMVPVTVLEAPEGREAEAAAAFAWEIDTRELPLGEAAQAVYVSGGSIYFESERRNITVRQEDLSPLA